MSHSTTRSAFARGIALTALLVCGFAGGAQAGKTGTTTKTSYTYYPTGNPSAPVATTVTPKPQSSIVLMGGGPDVTPAFRWMIQQAGVTPGSGGRFVVIRASGADGYNPFIWYTNTDADRTVDPVGDEVFVGGRAMGLSSVETLVISSQSAANDANVLAIVNRANALFIAGGDQSQYVNYWKGTALESAIRNLHAKHVPIGGTSAGMMVLGNFDYVPTGSGATSAQALSDPYNRYMQFDPAPFLAGPKPFLDLPSLANAVTDSHLDARDRMGRLASFLARINDAGTLNGQTVGCPDGPLPVAATRAIGVGVETALLISKPTTNFIARRVTNDPPPPVPSYSPAKSAAYFLSSTADPTVCASRKPLTFTGITVQRLSDLEPNGEFNLDAWLPVSSGTLKTYTLNISNGILTSTNNGGLLY
jgi:cyanophycinase-like exopeptidase